MPPRRHVLTVFAYLPEMTAQFLQSSCKDAGFEL
jgi:hypothetical protein